MTIAVFISIWSMEMSPADLREYFLGTPLVYLKTVTAVQAVEIYTPEPGDAAALDELPAPAIILQIDFDDADAASGMVGGEGFRSRFLERTLIGPGIEKIKLEITEAVHFPLPGIALPPPRTAPLSFVVRYYGPVRNATEFVDFYTKNHPPLLAQFGNIRNVLCYLPLGWRNAGELTDDSLILGNEVVFDDLTALKRALDSDVLPAVMEDSKQFQKFGYNTHHAMRRTRVFAR